MSSNREHSAPGDPSADGVGHALSPAARRLLWIVGYYAAAGVALALVWPHSPALRSLIESDRLHDLAAGGAITSAKDAASILDAPTEPWRPGSATLLALAGALFAALPVAWIYSLTRRKRGFEQSMVHTLILLPVAVAGTVMLIQNSLALAFGLTGIVAMLRFRNTLEDTKDGVYIFIAMSIGISAAVGVLVVGIATSMVFGATVLTLWWLDFARAPTPGLRGGMRRLARLPSATPGVRAADGRFNATLRVHVASSAPSQPALEDVLEDHTKRWELVGIRRADGQRSTLEYLVRVRKSSRGELLGALQAAAPQVTSVELS